MSDGPFTNQTQDYNVEESEICEDCAVNATESYATFHAKMYVIGDRYIVPGLKTTAQAKFRRSLPRVTSVTLASLVDEVFASTPADDRGLRDLVIEHSGMRVKELIGDRQFFEQAQHTDCFGLELTKWVVEKVQSQSYYQYSTSGCCHCPVQDRASPRPQLYCRHQRVASVRPADVL